MYERSCELIYSMISRRILERKQFLGLRNIDICDLIDPSLMSAIIHNRRNPKRNKYLIPGGTRNTFVSFNDTPIINMICTNLKYDSVHLLITGNSIELDEYIQYLFQVLIIDALDCESTSAKKVLEDLLSDYLPYALCSSYFEALNDHGDVIDVLFREEHIPSDTDSEYSLKRAIDRLYHSIEYQFPVMFVELFIDIPNTLKLDKRLSTFVRNRVIPELESCRYRNPFIKNAKEQLRMGYDEAVHMFTYSIYTSPENDHYHQGDLYYYKDDLPIWFDAFLDYTEKLSELQIQEEQDHFIREANNVWKPSSCLIDLIGET